MGGLEDVADSGGAACSVTEAYGGGAGSTCAAPQPTGRDGPDHQRKGKGVRRFFEDFTIGETWESREIELSQDDIIRYARENDPQPMHTDPEAASAGRFGGVIASGWQIAALSMRVFVEAGGYGKTPMVGMGIDELRWRRPVRPGDRLKVTREVISTEPHQKRPEFGVVRTKVTVTNQDNDVVMTLISLGQVPVRPTGEADDQ
ncbi:MaoC family dehydratase [Falsirhodobacter halotolerans]|uniref:MaoC family dehydratase n=1 Tax=Falsirhodobacter halotolerans TaxID=1146892 RepID=UPI001FD136C6|nr:MaoC family dehydratase [Falsirhodobacter halotolerans]MCJ8140056.1 MaoC family dehydratase [Falsirhodobacter halotolerans]